MKRLLRPVYSRGVPLAGAQGELEEERGVGFVGTPHTPQGGLIVPIESLLIKQNKLGELFAGRLRLFR